jgi:hypothetical protein
MKKRFLFASCILVILVAFMLAGALAATGGRLNTPVARETWEYKVVSMRLFDMPVDKESQLNKLGAEAWELVLWAHNETGGSIYDIYLKRRK